MTESAGEARIPRDKDNDYTAEAAAARREFAAEQSGAELEHVGSFSVDPAGPPGNIENFTGVAQVPIGLAGPLLVDGEHAQGEFYVPMATAEGTLVASYNRGMKLLREAGGVKTTVIDDRMQRAPSFLFPSAREARELRRVARDPLRADQGGGRGDDLQRQAAGHPAVRGEPDHLHPLQLHDRRRRRPEHDRQGDRGRLQVDPRQLRRASSSSCSSPTSPPTRRHSQINMLRTRGKRVVAEAVIPNALVSENMRSRHRSSYRARQMATLGGSMAGVNNNGSHSANGIAALFIATGQDAANVAESSAADRLRRAARERRLLLLDHAPGPDRRHLRRRHRPADPARMPRADGLLRRRQGPQVRRDRRRDRALRRDHPRRRGRRRRVGRRPRHARPQPA